MTRTLTLLAAAALAATAFAPAIAKADPPWERGWHHRHWRGDDDGWRRPYVYARPVYVAPPPVYYAPPPPPPPVYYAPPAVYAPAGISFGINIPIR